MCPRAPALQREATAKRRLYITTKGSSPHPLQLEEPYAQQQRLSTAKNKLKKKKKWDPNSMAALPTIISRFWSRGQQTLSVKQQIVTS